MTIMIALVLGFRTVLWLGALAYLLAFAVLKVFLRQGTNEEALPCPIKELRRTNEMIPQQRAFPSSLLPAPYFFCAAPTIGTKETAPICSTSRSPFLFVATVRV